MSVPIQFKVPADQTVSTAEELKAEYDRLRKEDDLVRVQYPYGGDGWMAVKYPVVREFYSDERFGIEPQLELDDYPRIRFTDTTARRSFMQYDGERHSTRRSVLMKYLTVKRVKEMRPRFQTIVNETLDDFEALGNPGEIARNFGRLVPVKVIAALLGSDVPDPEFLEASHFLIDGKASNAKDAGEALAIIEGFLDDLYEEKKRKPDDSVFGALIRDTEAGQWTDEELRGLGFTLVAAGHSATGNMLSGIIEWLSYDQELYQRLRTDPDALPRALQEFYRVITIGPGIPRTRLAVEDATIGGIEVKKGEAIGGNLIASNFDPTVFPNPNVLDIDRVDPAPIMTFGYGKHACVGSQVARAEIGIAIQTLLDRYETFVNVEPAAGWLERRYMKGPQEVHVDWKRA